MVGVIMSGASLVVMLRGMGGQSYSAFGDSIIIDPFFIFFGFIFLASTALVILISVKYMEIEREQHGEYYALMLFATVGMMFLACGNDPVSYTHLDVYKRQYQQFAPYVDRMDYVAAVSNGLGYCEAVEKLMAVEAPPRARVIRTILTELQRIASHLVWLGTHALDIGALTPLFYCCLLYTSRCV